MTAVLSFALTLVAGGAQATLMAFSARLPLPLRGFLPRFLLVGAALVVAARTGHLWLGVVGWAAGFLVGALVAARKGNDRASPSAPPRRAATGALSASLSQRSKPPPGATEPHGGAE